MIINNLEDVENYRIPPYFSVERKRRYLENLLRSKHIEKLEENLNKVGEPVDDN